MTNDNRNHATWENPIEFLLSCISMSVGLGNVWRFPFTAVSSIRDSAVTLTVVISKPYF